MVVKPSNSKPLMGQVTNTKAEIIDNKRSVVRRNTFIVEKPSKVLQEQQKRQNTFTLPRDPKWLANDKAKQKLRRVVVDKENIQRNIKKVLPKTTPTALNNKARALKDLNCAKDKENTKVIKRVAKTQPLQPDCVQQSEQLKVSHKKIARTTVNNRTNVAGEKKNIHCKRDQETKVIKTKDITKTISIKKLVDLVKEKKNGHGVDKKHAEIKGAKPKNDFKINGINRKSSVSLKKKDINNPVKKKTLECGTNRKSFMNIKEISSKIEQNIKKELSYNGLELIKTVTCTCFRTEQEPRRTSLESYSNIIWQMCLTFYLIICKCFSIL